MRLLVVCTGNRARSQMSEGWLRRLGDPEWVVQSAGLRPKGLHPVAVQVMAERGLDISGHTSDPLSHFLDQEFDAVVVHCPIVWEEKPHYPPCRELIFAPIPDPDRGDPSPEGVLTVFRETRDWIEVWAREFVGRSRSSSPSSPA